MPSLIDNLLNPLSYLKKFFPDWGKPAGLVSQLAANQATQAAVQGNEAAQGMQVPGFILLGSFCIFLLFIVCSVVILIRARKFALEFALLAKSVKAVQQKKEFYQELEAAFSKTKNQVVGPGLFSLIVPYLAQETQSSSPGMILLKPVDQIIVLDQVVTDTLGLKYFQVVPGVLTGAGLLMTFVAILEGLSHVQVTAQMDVQGISGLINGLSGKFISSIVAVASSIAFTFVERFAVAQVSLSLGQLCQVIARKVIFKPAERILFELSQSLKKGA